MVDTNVNDIEAITVIGAGSMGHGIAQVFAMHQYDVTLVDVDESQLSTAHRRIERSLKRLGEDPSSTLEHITMTADQADSLSGADMMIEAVPEKIELKKEIFAAADEAVSKETILATNTSTLPVTEMADVTAQPERVVGMHFSNPVPLMEIVEVISGENTSDEVMKRTETLSEAVGKTPVVVKKDVPGFLLNRINYAFWSEALRKVDNGTHVPEVIDASIRRLGFPMGPFEVLDFAGVDVFYMVCHALKDRGVPVAISETHEERVNAEAYGMKSGEGFYEYPEPGEYSRADIPMERRYECNPYPMIASAVNAAAWLIDNGVTTKEDVDTAMKIGMNWPRGLFELADEYGIDQIVAVLNDLHEQTGRDQYEPHSLLEQLVEKNQLGWKTGKGFYEHDYETTSFESVEYEKHAFIARITLSRPEKKNAMDERAWRGFRTALERASEDSNIRATIIEGKGGVFSAGDDIAEMSEWKSVEEGQRYADEVLLPAIEELRSHSQPTICLVDGVAAGAGCELVLLSDIAVATERSQFGQPEGTIGALPPIWLTYGVTNIGKKKALELAMTGELLTATEAREIGLLNYVIGSDQILDVARELARSTTASAPGSIESIKAAWNGVEEELFAEHLQSATGELAEQVLSDEGRHGLQRFLAGDPPQWEK